MAATYYPQNMQKETNGI